jgi:geranylgeranyl diphosphate synthase type II
MTIETARPGTAIGDAELMVDFALRSFFRTRIARAERLGPEYLTLWRQAERLSQGGKRFRPALVLQSYRAFGGTDDYLAAQLGAAFEILHTAFLIHDDVIDGDDIRRGSPTLSGGSAETARRAGLGGPAASTWAQASGILAGDLLLIGAQGIVASLPIDTERRLRLLELFDESVLVTAAGELADVALSVRLRGGDIDEALAMSERKTAVYSFDAPLVAGAILAGATESDQAVLSAYGRTVGTAFQLRDDLLGVFGDEGVTGKSAMGDLREGKTTPLIVFARATEHAEAIDRLLGRPDLTEKDAERLRRLLTECGARARVEDLIGRLTERATTLVSDAGLGNRFTAELIGLAANLHGRSR